jgi:hypothetical protein
MRPSRPLDDLSAVTIRNTQPSYSDDVLLPEQFASMEKNPQQPNYAAGLFIGFWHLGAAIGKQIFRYRAAFKRFGG